jgi:hypothetical protein
MIYTTACPMAIEISVENLSEIEGVGMNLEFICI